MKSFVELPASEVAEALYHVGHFTHVVYDVKSVVATINIRTVTLPDALIVVAQNGVRGELVAKVATESGRKKIKVIWDGSEFDEKLLD